MIRLLEGPGSELVRQVKQRLERHERIRMPLPHGGRLFIDRDLPFLTVYRTPPDRPDAGTSRLVTGQAAYLYGSGEAASGRELSALVTAIASTIAPQFGGFLVLELWSAPRAGAPDGPTQLPRPRFRVHAPADGYLAGTTETLANALADLEFLRSHPEVEIEETTKIAPPGLSPILKASRASRIGAHILGLEIEPIHQDPRTGEPYPLLLEAMRRRLTAALAQAFGAFMSEHTRFSPPHFEALGRRTLGHMVWEVDRQLAELSEAFDFTLQVTPINVQAAWHDFASARFDKPPRFQYRPLPIDPSLHKRRLFQVPVDKVEDPTLHHLFTEKVNELDRQLTLLVDRNTPRFLHGSIALYGGVEPELLELAERVLRVVPARERDEEDAGDEHVSAWAFEQMCVAEIEAYKQQDSKLVAEVQVREDVAGLMHSRGNVLVGTAVTLSRSRVDALIQHEVGTHLVCYHNGRAQPFQQLYAGLRGYRELQEGLAVLAEYLVGGLDRPRLRVIAARVVAAHAVIEGATFIDTFRLLQAHHGLGRDVAWRVTMRAFRGGGLVRDAVYLRALKNLLEYLTAGNPIEPLFVGRIALEHVPIVRELQWREVLKPPPLRPRYLERPEVQVRLERIRREGLTPLDLVFDRSRYAAGHLDQRRA